MMLLAVALCRALGPTVDTLTQHVIEDIFPHHWQISQGIVKRMVDVLVFQVMTGVDGPQKFNHTPECTYNFLYNKDSTQSGTMT